VCDHTREIRRVKVKRAVPMNKVDFSDDVKEIRRRQFFNFFADFYNKHEGEIIDSEEEKAETIKDLFKRYYTADANMPKVEV
jgi:hypothetical protein